MVTPPTLRVFKDHQLVKEYPADHTTRFPDDGSLQVVKPAAPGQFTLVETLPAGAWHGVGHQLVCAFVDNDASCPRCNPVSPA